ncbi:MAG TPA: M81 family metallopeptidase [Alphaproteobacteria bacterium]|nr:M81 family metallopeptidase [Alphaproteobacteria bacterium]
MTRHLAVVRVSAAANSFGSAVADREAFARGEWAEGEAALAAGAAAGHELAAVEAFTAGRADWRVSVLRSAATDLVAPLDDDLFTDLQNEIQAKLAGRRWDAVYLALHGAAVTTRRVRPELGLIAAARSVIDGSPLGASFDIHANMAPEAVRYLTYASGARSAAVGDRRSAAQRVLEALACTAEGRLKPVGAVVKAFAMLPGVDLPSEDAARAGGPMAEVQALARGLEAGAVLDVSAFTGFAYADTPDAGAAGMAYADGDAAAARHAASEVAAALSERRAAFWTGAPREFADLPYIKVPADLRPRP